MLVDPLGPADNTLTDEEHTIKVASKKDKATGTIKLKKPVPKPNKPGIWRDGNLMDGMVFPLFAP